MADVIVVGAGIGGLAAAARLAKLGHAVVVCERNGSPGGRVRRVEHEGHSWDSGPASTTLPAVLRDLFHTTGRPIERYVDLRLRPVARRHVFADGSEVDLPTGSRAGQVTAVDAGLGPGSGAQWAHFVDRQAATWHALRELVLDPPDGGARLGERAVARQLAASTSLARLLRRSLRDERLRLMVAEPHTRAGSDSRRIPSYAAAMAYVERSFGVWTAAGGMAAVTAALITRLAERGVDVRYDCEVRSITTRRGRVTGVVTFADSGSSELVNADVVVTDVDARVVFGRLLAPADAPVAARAFATAPTTAPPTVTHLGLAGDVAALPDEVVFHGNPGLVVTTAGSAPPGHHAWTVERHGDAAEDVLLALARCGLDVRSQVVARVDRTPADLLDETGGSSYGTPGDGWRSHARRAAHGNPVPGLYLVGSSVHPGSSLPFVAWGASHVAARVGKVER